MADPDRDFEQALLSLKKGTQLLKYNRKGKPKFRAFRLSLDETTLIWLSHGEEKTLKLASVSRIIPGQRTAVFRRLLCPDKEHLSFSLIYNNGDRSLDLICKDRAEAQIWFKSLRTLIGFNRRKCIVSDISEIPDLADLAHYPRISNATLETSSSIVRGRKSYDSYHEHATMQLRTSADGNRISVSSVPSNSSGGSAPDDFDSLGDVYVWGEVWTELIPSDRADASFPIKTDALLPKPLESNVVLDTLQISCGTRHVALVTRQGEVFTWGEEIEGRLGHGLDKDFPKPHHVDHLTMKNIEHVACGEYNTCAVTNSGDLYTFGWGHWLPKRIFDGAPIVHVACGTWHTALVTLNGKLFTFGDGAFGVLGHGDMEHVASPKEVMSLSEVKTVKVACGVWHTAAIVELSGSSGSTAASKKLFTWGDGDKYRLGHGNKDSFLEPTAVASLVDYNFHQLACGHTMTVALTTSGHVFTMGASTYGQLGSTTSDGKSPSLVQDKLVGEFVEEVACGANHVVVLTSRSEVFTWGKGTNGQLGHGDVEDRKVPTIVEALRDRHVKSIACGANFTFTVCSHKWVSGTDQTVCASCRQAFGFTRKRHNCYNCGLAHCHACSSKKALKAALAPTPSQPHRVCDTCHAKLKASENGNNIVNRKQTNPREIRASKMLLNPATTTLKHTKPTRQPPTQPPSAHPPPARPQSPYGRRPSPPRSSTPTFSRSILESLRKSNETLKNDVAELQEQVKSLKQRYEAQEGELRKLQKQAHEAASIAAMEMSKMKVAREIIIVVSTQLKEMSENEEFKPMIQQMEMFLANEGTESYSLQMNEHDNGNAHGVSKRERMEQFEVGVYVTYIQQPNGVKVFKRVKFSKKRFKEHEAEVWWRENKDRLLKRYGPLSGVGGHEETLSNCNEGSSSGLVGDENLETTVSEQE